MSESDGFFETIVLCISNYNTDKAYGSSGGENMLQSFFW